jgi:Ca2+-binding EF-hand superfamily protein
MNLFVAIILSGYFEARSREGKALNTVEFEHYTQIWS